MALRVGVIGGGQLARMMIRKVGHVNVVGDDLDDVVYTARAAAAHFA